MKFVLKTCKVLLLLFLFSISAFASGKTFYVISATYSSQIEAQRKAATNGGWVLPTNFYQKLRKNRYAVVRGPYSNENAAIEKLNFLKESPTFKKTTLKEVGEFSLKKGIEGSALTPVLVAALLGEINIQKSKHSGGTEPCVPQSTYRSFTFSFIGLERDTRGKFVPVEKPIPLGGFWKVLKTGEIDRMRVCAE